MNTKKTGPKPAPEAPIYERVTDEKELERYSQILKREKERGTMVPLEEVLRDHA